MLYQFSLKSQAILSNLGCWKESKIVGTNAPLENIGLVENCQRECKNDIECRSFLHQASTQKCWLQDDTNFEPEVDYNFVGPRECPAETPGGKELVKSNKTQTQSIQNNKIHMFYENSYSYSK